MQRYLSCCFFFPYKYETLIFFIQQFSVDYNQRPMQGMNPKIIMMLAKQSRQCQNKAPDGVRMIINQTDATDIQAQIEGPTGTPYQGGVFRCKLAIENDFPNKPPKGYFITKIFHPNVSEKGQICVNTLKKDWNPAAWSLINILEVIKCLLIVPFPQSALNQEAGKMFMQDYDEYFKYAKLITELHAKPKQLKAQQINMPKKQGLQQNGQQMQQQKMQQSLAPKKQNGNNNKKKWMKRI